MGDRYESAYTAWLQEMHDTLVLGVDPFDSSAEVRHWLRTVHRENGDLPADRLGVLVHARRLRLAAEAAAAIGRAFRADRHGDAAVPVTAEPPTGSALTGQVQVGDQVIQGLDGRQIAVQAADGFQCYVADVHWLVWPTCPGHRTGVHPCLVSGTAVWLCTAAGHILGPVVTPPAG